MEAAGVKRKTRLRPLLSAQLRVAPEKIEHPAQRVSLSQAHLCHPRLGVRHGCKNAFGDPRAQEPDGHPKPLRPLAHGAQTSHDEPPRKAAVNVH